MFRIRASERAQIPKSAAIVLAMLLLALTLSIAAVVQVGAEYRLLGDWQSRTIAVTSLEVATLRRDIGARIIVRAAQILIVSVRTLRYKRNCYSFQEALCGGTT